MIRRYLSDMKYNLDIHYRQSIRLKEYDYSQQGGYFVTTIAQNRDCLFGDVIDDGIALNEAGEIA